MASEKQQTIAEALNINEEWAVLNRHRIEKANDEFDTVSETIMHSIERLREEELGESKAEISEYEKKLVLVGLHLAQEIMSRRQSAIIGIPEALIQTLQGLRGKLNGEDEEKN